MYSPMFKITAEEKQWILRRRVVAGLSSKLIMDEDDTRLQKIFFDLYDNSDDWLISYGITSNNIFIYSGNKLVGWATFHAVSRTSNGKEDALIVSFDVRKSAKDKNAILRKLLKELLSQISKIKGLKYFSSEFSTPEGKKAGQYLAHKLGLELIQRKSGY